MRAEADAAKALVRRRDDELAAATLALSDEQARLAAVRAQLATAERERAAEAEARTRATRELNSALQVCAYWDLVVQKWGKRGVDVVCTEALCCCAFGNSLGHKLVEVE